MEPVQGNPLTVPLMPRGSAQIGRQQNARYRAHDGQTKQELAVLLPLIQALIGRLILVVHREAIVQPEH